MRLLVAAWLCCGAAAAAPAAAPLAPRQHLKERREQPHLVGGGKSGKQGKLKVLVLMSDTGGGHRASANALTQALQRLCPGEFDVTLFDVWTAVSGWPWDRAVPAYRVLGKRPWLWRLLWYGTAMWPGRVLNRWFHDVQLRGRFIKAMARFEPDMVVSVHPMCQHVPLSALGAMARRRGDERVPFATIVTDLGSAHPNWFDKRADAVFVPSARVERVARFHGVPREKIILHGLPLRAAFCDAAKHSSRRADRAKARRRARAKLGLAQDRPVVLVAGGGDGFGGVAQIVGATADALAKKGLPAQLVAVCGHNAQLAAEILAVDWCQCAPGVDVKVTGFLENMHTFMAASDVLLTKAGPGTIAEAAALGLPVVLTSFLPGQERGNVHHVVEGGFGALAQRPAAAGRAVAAWLEQPAALEAMADAARLTAKPLATASIAADIAALAKRHSRRSSPRR